jgi:hypothetical protein
VDISARLKAPKSEEKALKGVIRCLEILGEEKHSEKFKARLLVLQGANKKQ